MPSVKTALRLGDGESLVAAKSAAGCLGTATSHAEADFKGSSSVRRSPPPRRWGGQERNGSFRQQVPLTRRQEAAKKHQRAEARQGKTHRMWVLSVQTAAANDHQRTRANLGFACARPRKVGHDARAFRETSTFPATGLGRCGRRRARRHRATLGFATTGCILPPGQSGRPSRS